jgi:hypothetical protein
VIAECATAMSTVLPTNKVLIYPSPSQNSSEVSSYSRQWPCLFPQHGPGPKHGRLIRLVDWQEEIAVAHPEQLLRGLVHSDGCRGLNTVTSKGKRYSYSRYTFCQRSEEIRSIFCRFCDQLGIEWRVMNAWNISVARRTEVAKLDAFIGPKR